MGSSTTYEFPGAENTYFYALGNNGDAAGYYEDSKGLHHGIVLKNGELSEYHFPGGIETEIYGISDATGALTGNWTDAEGVRRGFTGDVIVEYPGAVETFADFINASGGMIGSYVNENGEYTPYLRSGDDRYVSFTLPTDEQYEFFFVHGITDSKVSVSRGKVKGGALRTYVGSFLGGLHELKIPGSVTTQGWNINQDLSVVGYYDSIDGRRHGFIARLTEQAPIEPPIEPPVSDYTFETIAVPGVDFLALTTSNEFGDYAGYTRSGEKMMGFTLIDDVFEIYDFEGAMNTYFYALDNNGDAVGYYEDSEGLRHGIILRDGEMSRYDFPNSVETEIYAINNATGALTGSFADGSGIWRGFSGNEIIEFPESSATYAYYVNMTGFISGKLHRCRRHTSSVCASTGWHFYPSQCFGCTESGICFSARS